MSIFTNWPQQAGLMPSKPSPIKKDDYANQWLGNIDIYCMQNVIKMYHEL